MGDIANGVANTLLLAKKINKNNNAPLDRDPKMLRAEDPDLCYLFLGGLRIAGGVDMLPTHGALHHVPLGGVAVGPPTARARQALQQQQLRCLVTEFSANLAVSRRKIQNIYED